MTKPIMGEPEWAALFIGGDFPDVYVNVWDLRARIMANGQDITELIPNGKKLALDAVQAAGGTITMSGWYPPSEEILSAIEELRKKGHP
jgi:hypothetical protein